MEENQWEQGTWEEDKGPEYNGSVGLSIPIPIVMSPTIPYEQSMFIDVFDIGYTQSNLMAIYEKLVEVTNGVLGGLNIDTVKAKLDEITAPFIGDPWEIASKFVQNIKDKVEEVSKLETNADELLKQLNQKIEELTKPDLINAKQIATIQVPLPNHIRDGLRHAYKTDSLNVIEKIIRGTSGAMGGGVDAVIQKDIQLAARKNFVFNPNNLVVYQGTGLRQYNFDIILMPQNASEIKNIRDGILKLKQYSSADNISLHNNDVFLTMKGIFRFRFDGVLNDLMDVRREDMFYLTQIKINYVGNGEVLTRFEDGNPKQLTLSLTFRERLPQYFNEIDKERLQKYNPLEPENKKTEANTANSNMDSSSQYDKSINKKINSTKTSEVIQAEDRKKQIIEKANS